MSAWLAVCISAFSFILALTSLIVTYRQKRQQDRLSARKTLSDNIDSLIDISIESSKLPFGKDSTNEAISLRRSLATRRRFLVKHAMVLAKEIPELCNDVDYNVIASAYDQTYAFEASEAAWLRCIELSSDPSARAMNRRGIARFYFGQGRFEDGRRQYQLSLEDVEGDSDASRRLRADTHAMWSATELDFGFIEEAKRRRHLAESESNRIAGKKSREDMLNFIHSIVFEDIADKNA
ncbi:hypothetical protein [Rhizobium sp. NXC24]|uniref:hypothetical protein n=1 Tax=Rhizobium sp. NXC24 TaxID=2048897 RepID=UPI00131A49C5|nr:hypothetical protein [Rhizobium sp. NXC24]